MQLASNLSSKLTCNCGFYTPNYAVHVKPWSDMCEAWRALRNSWRLYGAV